jgi:ABC-type multidrug transport system ATPase subunit
VLLLDEPTASLDARVQRDYLSSLRALRDAGKTIVFATHRIEEVERLSDRVLVMEGGRIVAQLAPEELRGWE